MTAVIEPAAPMVGVRWRDVATIEGTIRSVRARPWGNGVATLECTVLVLLDHLDRSAARAVQYARTLRPDELRAVHIAADPERAESLLQEWHELPLAKFPLELVACPDRRIARAALEVVAEEVADGRTEGTVLLPRREYKEFWHRFLHDRTSDSIAKALAVLPHANVTFVPYHLVSAHHAETPTVSSV